MSIQLTVDVASAENHRDVFEKLASFQEVFGVEKCGKCGSEDLRYVVRVDDSDNKYFELKCKAQGCYSKLRFGCTKQGNNLFPKRKNEAGDWLPDNGFVRWNKETGKEE